MLGNVVCINTVNRSCQLIRSGQLREEFEGYKRAETQRPTENCKSVPQKRVRETAEESCRSHRECAIRVTGVTERAETWRAEIGIQEGPSILNALVEQAGCTGEWTQDQKNNKGALVSLSPRLAAQCGYSLTVDFLGNAKFLASVLSCFAQNTNDETYKLTVQISVFSNSAMTSASSYVQSMTCRYSPWAEREILCERNYMEVSVRRGVPLIDPNFVQDDPDWSLAYPEATAADNSIWKIVFHLPANRKTTMNVAQAMTNGYGINTTPTRILVRAAYNATESQPQVIQTVPMAVLRSTTFYKQRWMVMMVDTAVTCPTDSTYNDFYGAQDYPVVKYLRRPLYFEVELLYSRDPQAELFLENCWATYSADRNISPKWDVVVDSCENSADEYLTIFHPVSSNARVLFPSHLKRFEVKMFSFTSGRDALKGQIYFHCSVVICDSNRPSDSLCSRRCIPGKQRLGRSAEGMDGGAVKAFVSSGPIELKRDGSLRFMPRSASSYVQSMTCRYSPWAEREILCERNYMEVSVRRGVPLIEPNFVQDDPDWSLAYPEMPGEPRMVSVMRLLNFHLFSFSSCFIKQAICDVLRSTTFYKQRWMVMMVDTAVACPTDGTAFTEQMITWNVPRVLPPLVPTPQITTLDVQMGVDGRKLDPARIHNRDYKLDVGPQLITVKIPVGADGGYYKSHVLDNTYVISYSIEPMLEHTWQDGPEKTKYTVLHPITTPFMPRPPVVTNNTVPKARVFNVTLGTFLPDVELVKIIVGPETLTVPEANLKGYNVQEHVFPNGSKTYTLQVPFEDPNVKQKVTPPDTRTYILPLTYLLNIVPENTSFTHPAVVEAVLKDIIPPTVTGYCDGAAFYTMVIYGNMSRNWIPFVGSRELGGSLLALYKYNANSTNFWMTVPYNSVDATYEVSDGTFKMCV
ncbi:UNVERIFIED_CONTAM: hypothetical protein FKN15_066343 [Acipenser sinensis]